VKTAIGTILLIISLSGCGVSRVVPDEYGQPFIIIESSYTTGGCIRKLKAKASVIGMKIDKIVVDNSNWGTTAKILMWPFIKGTSCTAELVLQEAP
jgi:hypothetical protein